MILARPRGNLTGAIVVGPAFCYILLVVIYPLFYSLWASFTNMRLTSPLTSFVGLDTYAQALSSEIFQDSLAVTALFLVSVVVLEFILERVTNIAMGTELHNVSEFEEILCLDPSLTLDDVSGSVLQTEPAKK